MCTITEHERLELDLYLSTIEKIIDGKIDVEQGENPVDKVYAVSMYLSAAREILNKDEINL